MVAAIREPSALSGRDCRVCVRLDLTLQGWGKGSGRSAIWVGQLRPARLDNRMDAEKVAIAPTKHPCRTCFDAGKLWDYMTNCPKGWAARWKLLGTVGAVEEQLLTASCAVQEGRLLYCRSLVRQCGHNQEMMARVEVLAWRAAKSKEAISDCLYRRRVVSITATTPAQ